MRVNYYSDIEKTWIYSSEDDLVNGLRERNREALEYLYSKYSSALYGVIRRVVELDHAAEEVLQDAFLKIWEKIDAYDNKKGRLFTWMLAICRNLAIDKKRSREISKESKTNSLENYVSEVEASESIEQSINTIGLPDSLDQLPEEQKFVVEYLYLKGYTQSELAEEFGIPLGTVKTRLRLAMTQLRLIL